MFLWCKNLISYHTRDLSLLLDLISALYNIEQIVMQEIYQIQF